MSLKFYPLSACLLLLCMTCLPLKAQQIIFIENFENGSFGDQWQLNTGTPNGVIEVLPTQNLEGAYAARLGKSKDEEAYTLNRLDLAIDLSAYRQVMLQLMVAHNREETHAQDGIYLSQNGGKYFEKIYDFRFEEWPEQAGMLPPVNLSALAAEKNLSLGAQTVIRFQQYGNKDFTGGQEFSDGLYLDQISLVENDISHASLPFEENFDRDSLSAPWLIGDPMRSDSSGTITPAGLIEISQYDDAQGKVLKMGSQLDKHPATNAVDLHLNLDGQQGARLSFDIYDNREETHPADGIFFSDDGGVNFTKVFAFDFDNWQDRFFGSIRGLDVHTMASAHGLVLNEQFVIRFQQFDDDDFRGTRLSSDGVMLDNIKVARPEISYAALPFEDDFEQEELAAHWQVGDPRASEYFGVVSNNGQIALLTPDHAGSQMVCLGNRRDKSYTTNALDLFIRMAERPGAILSFSYYDHYDETHEQDGIFFSNDGGRSFKKVFSFDSDTYHDKAVGHFRALNIARLAADRGIELTDRFVIRFQQYDEDDFTGTRTISDGYCLDNIRIYEPTPRFASVPFREDFEQDQTQAYWHRDDLHLTANASHIRPGGLLTVADSMGHQSSRGLVMGRSEDGRQTTNGTDLYLNLEGVHNMRLNFTMLNMQASSGEENGLWYSDDAGRSFSKIWQISGSHDTFRQYKLNLDSLLRKAGKRYSPTAVLRFQQSDHKKLNRNSSISGGIIIDNITLAQELPMPQLSWPGSATRPPDCSEYTFAWTTSARAENYQLQIYTHINGREEIVRDTLVSVDQITVRQLPKDSSYFCRVRMVNPYLKGEWSRPLVFRTFETFEVSLQIKGVISEKEGVMLQASHLPAYEYQWYKNGEPVSNEKNYVFNAREPGKYTVFISNKDCGVMSPPVKLEAKAFGVLSNSEETGNAKDQGGR